MKKSFFEERLKKALRERNSLEVSVLRLLLANIHNREIEKKEELTAEELLRAVANEAKKRKEAIALYQKGGRENLVSQEKKELQILQQFLPKKMSETAINQLIEKAIIAQKAQGMADFGQIMGAVMKNAVGKASGDQVAKLVKIKLSKER